jgi:thioredoxin-related protein
MDATTFRDPAVAKLLASKFSSARLDGESESTVRWPPKKAISEASIAQGFGIRGFPTLLFLRPDRKELARISSYLPANQMKALLEAVLAYDASGSLDKGVDFESWYEKNAPKE